MTRKPPTRAERERVRAALTNGPRDPFGLTAGRWGEYGSATEHRRYADVAPNRRRRCTCGCGGPLTHYGMANGVALMGGCELEVRRWVWARPGGSRRD